MMDDNDNDDDDNSDDNYDDGDDDGIVVVVANANQSCILATRSQWSWTSTLLTCTQIHLQQAAEYHQVFNHLYNYEHISVHHSVKLCTPMRVRTHYAYLTVNS